MQKKQKSEQEASTSGSIDSIKRTRRVAMSWNQELKETALPDLKAHVDAIYGESVSNKQLFFLCMALGIQGSNMGAVPARKSDSVRLEYLDDRDFALLKTVALSHTKDFKILLDEDAIYDIAEQFASGGLEIIQHEMSNQANFPVWLIARLTDNLDSFARTN